MVETGLPQHIRVEAAVALGVPASKTMDVASMNPVLVALTA